MATHYYHSELYGLLAPSMIAALAMDGPVIAGWRHNTDPIQRIGEWAINAIIAGDANDRRSGGRRFANGEPRVRGEAVGHMAWSMMHAETVDDPIRDCLADLWDARVQHVRESVEDSQELKNFHWFIKSGKFESGWWLPRLLEAITLEPELAGEYYMIGKEVALAADVDRVVRWMLRGRSWPMETPTGRRMWELAQNALPIVIARAMDAGDELLRNDAILVMNELGEQGHVTLDGQVKSVQEGAITKDDVPD